MRMGAGGHLFRQNYLGPIFSGLRTSSRGGHGWRRPRRRAAPGRRGCEPSGSTYRAAYGEGGKPVIEVKRQQGSSVIYFHAPSIFFLSLPSAYPVLTGSYSALLVSLFSLFFSNSCFLYLVLLRALVVALFVFTHRLADRKSVV